MNQELSFEKLIDSFLSTGVGISTDFLSAELALQLRLNLLALYKKEELELAGIGNGGLLRKDEEVRKDKIFWIDRAHNNKDENLFLDLIDSFVDYLNKTCFSGIRSYEFHYALYEKGAFYKRHLDSFKKNDNRAFSMIMYLNEGWSENDGGELKVYHEAGFQIISPTNQKCVFFKSTDLEHEVLLSNVTRMSVTGWLKTANAIF